MIKYRFTGVLYSEESTRSTVHCPIQDVYLCVAHISALLHEPSSCPILFAMKAVLTVLILYFKEYCPEATTFGGSKRKKHSALADGNTGVTLTGVTAITSPDRNTGTGTPQHASNESSPAHGYGTEPA